MKSINEFLLAAAEEIIANAAKKSEQSELYKSDIAKFLVGLAPRDRVHLIDLINNEDRLATLEWSRRIERKAQELEAANGLTQVLKNDFEVGGEG